MARPPGADEGFSGAKILHSGQDSAFDAGQYSFFGNLGDAEDALEGGLEDGVEAPPEEEGLLGALEDDDLPLEDDVTFGDDVQLDDEFNDLSLTSLFTTPMDETSRFGKAGFGAASPPSAIPMHVRQSADHQHQGGLPSASPIDNTGPLYGLASLLTAGLGQSPGSSFLDKSSSSLLQPQQPQQQGPSAALLPQPSFGGGLVTASSAPLQQQQQGLAGMSGFGTPGKSPYLPNLQQQQQQQAARGYLPGGMLPDQSATDLAYQDPAVLSAAPRMPQQQQYPHVHPSGEAFHDPAVLTARRATPLPTAGRAMTAEELEAQLLSGAAAQQQQQAQQQQAQQQQQQAPPPPGYGMGGPPPQGAPYGSQQYLPQMGGSPGMPPQPQQQQQAAPPLGYDMGGPQYGMRPPPPGMAPGGMQQQQQPNPYPGVGPMPGGGGAGTMVPPPYRHMQHPHYPGQPQMMQPPPGGLPGPYRPGMRPPPMRPYMPGAQPPHGPPMPHGPPPPLPGPMGPQGMRMQGPPGAYGGGPPRGPRMASKMMTVDEVDTILRIQWRTLHNHSPYVEDYYYQAYVYGHYGKRNARLFAPEGLREGLGPAERVGGGAIAYVRVEGLGKIALSNIRRPKPLMDVATDKVKRIDSEARPAGRDTADGSSPVRPLEQEPLLAARIMIEDCMHLLLDVEDVDRLLVSTAMGGGLGGGAGGGGNASRGPDPLLLQHRQLLLDGLAASMRLQDAPTGQPSADLANGDSGNHTPAPSSFSDDGVFLRLLALRKGCTLLARALRAVHPPAEVELPPPASPAVPDNLGEDEGHGAADGNGCEARPRLLWATLRNARHVFSTAGKSGGDKGWGSAEGSMAVEELEVTSRIAAAAADCVQRLDSRAAVEEAAAALVGGDLGGEAAGGQQALLPLLAPGIDQPADPSYVWLAHVVVALLQRASELAPDSGRHTKEHPGQAHRYPWQASFSRLFAMLASHLEFLVSVYRAAAAGGEQTVELLGKVRGMVPSDVIRAALPHSSAEQRDQLRGFVRELMS